MTSWPITTPHNIMSQLLLGPRLPGRSISGPHHRLAGRLRGAARRPWIALALDSGLDLQRVVGLEGEWKERRPHAWPQLERHGLGAGVLDRFEYVAAGYHGTAELHHRALDHTGELGGCGLAGWTCRPAKEANRHE